MPFTAAETVRRGRLGPGRAAARRARPAGDPRGHRREGLGAPRAADPRRAAADPRGPIAPTRRRWPVEARRRARPRRCATSPASTPSAPGSTSRRWRSRRHEPLWSMGDDTPTAGRGRLDRPVADHLRQAFAQVTNPAIDPERERVVMDLRVELGRRPALLGGPPRGPRTLRLAAPDRGRPGRAARARSATGGATVRTLDATWDRPTAGRGWRPPWTAGGRRRRGRARRHRGPRPHRRARCRSTGCRCPSILAAGAVHTALTAAGLRGRTDVVVERRRHPRRPRDGDGPRRRRDGRPPAARDRAGGRAGRHARRRGPDRRTTPSATWSPRSRPGLRKTLARMGISAVASYIGGSLVDAVDLDADGRRPLLPDGRRVARPDDAGRPRRPAAPSPRGRARPAPNRPPAASRGCPIPASPGSAPTARRTSSRRGSPARSRSCPGRWRTIATAAAPTVDAALARYRGGAAPGPPTRPSVPRDELRVRARADADRRSTRSRTRGPSSAGSSCRR